MKNTLFVAATLFTMSALPALAGEGTGDIFALRTPGVTTMSPSKGWDAGSSQDAVVDNRAEPVVGAPARNTSPTIGSETPARTANPFIRGAKRGNVASVQQHPAVSLTTAER